MKKTILIAAIAIFILSCSDSSKQSVVNDNWTEKQEINFYNDCKGKLIEQGQSLANADGYCKCCLSKLKSQFGNGKDAMEQLTENDIQRIEKECMQPVEEGVAAPPEGQ